MAYSYTVIEFEVGDKLEPIPCTFDDGVEVELDGSEVLTIKTIEKGAYYTIGRARLTFYEIPGYWDPENFYLRPETPIRNIDPKDEE